ncbi:MAG: aminopeptidase YwaD [Thermoplasmata archaeon]|nr:aminopeptidase YwaD [Thermoplasmata archaeon]
MKLLLAAVATLLLIASLAGCADRSTDPATGNDPACTTGATDGAACTAAIMAPKVDARKTLDDLRDFSESFPYRQSGTPTHLASRDDLAGRLEAAGLEVVRDSFPSAGTSTAGGPEPEFEGENILGFKWGTDRSHWIVVGAHYDITEGAVYGTYDDGSGTAMVFELAAAFADVQTERTLVFAEFDQEEMGLVGSRAFIEHVLDGEFTHNGTIDGMVDLDMIGITWPHPADIIVWENSAALTAKVQELAAAVGVPSDHLQFRKSFGGSSDGAAFIDAGIATAYFWSDWDEYYLPDGSMMPDTPLPYVGPYPWWHKLDTYETMVVSAGDEATLQAGFQTTLDIVSPLLFHMASPAFVPDPEEPET